MTGDKREADNTDLTSTKKLKLFTDHNGGKIQRTYEDLVELTINYPAYRDQYTPIPNSISTATMKTSSKAKYRKVVALDCEMCLVENLSTLHRDGKAVVRVTLVDGEDPDEILVDLIVHQPAKGYRVVKYRTDCHGIIGDIIAESTITKERARKELLKYIGPDTIVVGQSLHGDLESCGIQHEKVIDTSYLYFRANTDLRTRTAGLREMTQQLLNIHLPEVHDSFLDAKMTMLVAKHALTNPIGEILRSKYAISNNFVSTNPDLECTRKLFDGAMAVNTGRWELIVHSIPRRITSKILHNFIVNTCDVVPESILDFKVKEGSWSASTRMFFLSKAHADIVFNSLPGKRGTDSINRPFVKVDVVYKGVSAKGVKFSTIY